MKKSKYLMLCSLFLSAFVLAPALLSAYNTPAPVDRNGVDQMMPLNSKGTGVTDTGKITPKGPEIIDKEKVPPKGGTNPTDKEKITPKGSSDPMAPKGSGDENWDMTCAEHDGWINKENTDTKDTKTYPTEQKLAPDKKS